MGSDFPLINLFCSFAEFIVCNYVYRGPGVCRIRDTKFLYIFLSIEHHGGRHIDKRMVVSKISFV